MPKLKKSKSKSFDIDNYFEDDIPASAKKKETIHSKIAKKFGDQFTIMKHLPRGEKTKTLSLVILTRLEAMAEEIVFAMKPKYRHPSEVHRAAHYMGLYQIYEHEIEESEKSFFYESLIMMEPIYLSQQKIDDTVIAYIRLKQYCEDDIMTSEEAKSFLENILSKLSKKERKIAEQKIQKVVDGAPVKEVFYHKTPGGKRGKVKENSNDYDEFPIQ